MLVVDYFILIVSILIIAVVLLQQSSDDATSALSGEKTELFKDRKLRGSELFLTRATLVLAIVFLVLVIISNAITRFM